VNDETRFELNLRRLLYRFDCPSPDILRDYYWTDLPPAQHHAIDRHLAHCPHCTAELRDLISFVGAEAARTPQPVGDPSDVAGRIRVIIARLITPKSGALALAGLRGEPGAVSLFEADELALTVSVEREERGRLTLIGQVLSSAPSPIDFTDGTVSLSRFETEPVIVTAALDRNGSFALTDVLPEDYQLAVNLRDWEVVIPRLVLSV
jgi:hypothetical protein